MAATNAPKRSDFSATPTDKAIIAMPDIINTPDLRYLREPAFNSCTSRSSSLWSISDLRLMCGFYTRWRVAERPDGQWRTFGIWFFKGAGLDSTPYKMIQNDSHHNLDFTERISPGSQQSIVRPIPEIPSPL